VHWPYELLCPGLIMASSDKSLKVHEAACLCAALSAVSELTTSTPPSLVGVCCWQGFAAREAAMDQIRLRETRPDWPTGVTVLGGSMFFKDTDRVLKTMRRRGTASAFGDGFARRYNPIHGADLAARCCCFACVQSKALSIHGSLMPMDSSHAP